MKTLSRKGFAVWANVFWLAQFVIELLAPLLRDYLVWRNLVFRPNLQIGCLRDSYFDSYTDRLYVLALLWLVSAPLMTVIAWKQPECWPQRLIHRLWDAQRPGLSWAALLAALALAVWPIAAAIRAPVNSTVFMEAARAVLIAIPALYYRAILLSAPDSPPAA